MSEIRKIIRFGNSLGVSLPAKILNQLKLDQGSYMEIFTVQDKIILRPVKTSEFLNLGFEREGEVAEA